MQVTTEAQLGLIGGTMGLLTGFSLLSGVEIIYYIVKFFCPSKLPRLTWSLLPRASLRTYRGENFNLKMQLKFKGRSQKKNTTLFGNFSQTSDPPHPPFWEPLIQKKNLVFILHFRPLGTFLVFTKKLKFCQYFYIYFWE